MEDTLHIWGPLRLPPELIELLDHFGGMPPMKRRCALVMCTSETQVSNVNSLQTITWQGFQCSLQKKTVKTGCLFPYREKTTQNWIEKDLETNVCQSHLHSQSFFRGT